MRRYRRAVVAATIGVLTLAGCTDVPTSSAPETIRPVPQDAGSAAPVSSPKPGIGPRELVDDFLTANAIEPGRHPSARTYLTAAARSKWSDTTVTVISDETVGTYKGKSPEVVVRGRIVGSLDVDGVYKPSLASTGDGGPLTGFPFTVKSVGGQFRINSLGKGLLLTTDQFQQAYKQYPLYFFDLAGRYLVPDLRWSGLDGTALEQWLVTQLATGPRDDLQKGVNSDTLPTQATAQTISVRRGTTTAIEIRGAQTLNATGKNQLAAQLAYTLNGASAGDLLSITDNGKGVHIPAVNSAEFTESSFGPANGPIQPQADVYYLRNCRIRSDNATTLTGPVNNGTYCLNSVALERTGSSTTLNVAGVVSAGAAGRLVVGTQRSGLHPTSLVGTLSRPAWVPSSNEVWVGDGPKLYRTSVGPDGKPAKPSLIAVPSNAPAGAKIVSLRLSPEGSRVAMVLASANQAEQLWVGTVVRGAGQVRVDTLTQVSPEGVAVTDVGWIEATKLFAIGYTGRSTNAKVFETNVDGSLFSARTFTLPDAPDSVTYAVGQLAWVSADGFVWVQSGSNWQSPGAIGQTVGTAPVYLE